METLRIERTATLSGKKGKAIKSVPVPNMLSSKEGEIIRINITLQIEDVIHGIITI